MRGSPTAQISVAIVCIVLGALLMLQYQTHGSFVKAQMAESSVDQTTIISNLYESNLALRKESETLAAQEAEYERLLDSGGLADMRDDVERIRVYNASEAVTGPGIELSIDSDIQAEHLLDLLNEFRNAGAEAIALNDVRIGVDSAVAGPGGKVVVDGVELGKRLVFRAVGNPDALDRALGRKGGVLSYLRNSYPGTQFVLVKRDGMTLPARKERPAPRFAAVAP
jgi:uncharacterized protein YlxW (UPF0749 family)